MERRMKNAGYSDGSAAAAQTIDREWMLDSGTSYHVMNNENTADMVATRASKAVLEKAAGEVKVEASAEVKLPGLPQQPR